MLILNKEQLISSIYSNKPESIHKIIPSAFFTKYDSYDYVWSGNCFEWYYAVSRALQPETFMEIGVRFGFSFLPAMLGSASLKYALGWDLETYGDNKIAIQNIFDYYPGKAKWEILHIDSQLETQLPHHFDFVSIDGCHDYGCKIHDLKMAMENSTYCLLDDYDYLPQVRRAVDDFLKNNANSVEWYEYIKTFRGSILIKFNNE